MLFTADSTHCANCLTENPDVDDDGETSCCLDIVCEVNALGRCPRHNPICDLCGFEITDGPDIENGRVIHVDRQCPTAKVEKPKKAPRQRQSPERKLAEGAGVVKPSTPRQSGSHADCDHEPTKSARAACRRKRAAEAGK